MAIVLLSSTVLATDIAYVTKTSLGVNQDLVTKLNNLGYSTTNILESQVSTTDFSQYTLILVGNQNLNAPENIPIHQHRSLVMNSYNYYKKIDDWQFGFSKEKGSISSPSNLMTVNPTTGIGQSITGIFQAYNTQDPLLKTYYLKGQKPSGIIIPVSSFTSTANAAIAAVNPGTTYLNGNVAQEKSVFFGIPDSQHWTQQSEQLFEDSINWLLAGIDFDNDGFLSELDCDDTNSNTFPGATEIPYDGIDQDCDGSDLDDLDNDGFNSELSGGLDCNDNDSNINPTNSDLALNCVNDSPIFPILDDLTISEGSLLIITPDATDPDQDQLTYTIDSNDFTFNTQTQSFEWQTSYNDEGTYNLEITVTDEEFSISRTLTLTIIDANIPPTFLDLTCTTTIDEDLIYTCDLEATDHENDEITFSTISESNLNCDIQNNILTYSSIQNYNGEASCVLAANDPTGSTTQTLSVTVESVNDAPEFSTTTPEEIIINILENTDKVFTISPEDPENDPIHISWFLDNQETFITVPTFTFNKPAGIYDLEAIISDTTLENSKFWTIIVGSASEFTCSEIGGNICTEDQICRSDTFGTSDSSSSNVCCSIACSLKPPEFKDANTCSSLNNAIEIDFDVINDEDEELGKSIDIEATIKNNYNERQNFDLELHLYDLSEDESIESIETEATISSNRDREIKFRDLEIPEDLDLDNDYVLLLTAEDDICNLDYKTINIDRQEDNIIISEFNLPETAKCGATIQVEIEVENLGSDDHDVTIEIENRPLGISESSEKFTLNEFDEKDDKETKTFTLQIPEDAIPEQYTIRANIDTYEQITETQTIKITCDQTQNFVTEGPSTITLSSEESQLNSKTSKAISKKSMIYTLLISILLLTIVLLGILFYNNKYLWKTK